MAITTTSQVLHDGPKNVVMQLTGSSDGAGGQETGVVKVDVSEFDPPCRTVSVRRVAYDVNGGVVKLLWDDDSAPVEFLSLSQTGVFDYRLNGGLWNARDAGESGDILLSTVGFEANSSYSLNLEMVKKF